MNGGPPRRCEHWIARKERFCSSTVVQAGERFCSQHTPEALAAARARSAAAAAAGQVSEQGAIEQGATELPDVRLHRKKYRRLESQHRAGRVVVLPTQWSWQDPSLPVHLDIGCARGRFSLELACEKNGLGREANHVGVEIRADLVEAAEAYAVTRGAEGRVRYAALDMSEASDARAALFSALGELAVVSVLFPDPYRHPRGRTLSSSLAEAIAGALPRGGVVFVASDKEHVATDMCQVLDDVRAFERVAGDDAARGALLHALRHLEGAASALVSEDGAESLRTTEPPEVREGVSTLDQSLRDQAPGLVGDELSSDKVEVREGEDTRWLGRNVWGRPTEREMCCEQPDRHGALRSVHRALYVRL